MLLLLAACRTGEPTASGRGDAGPQTKSRLSARTGAETGAARGRSPTGEAEPSDQARGSGPARDRALGEGSGATAGAGEPTLAALCEDAVNVVRIRPETRGGKQPARPRGEAWFVVTSAEGSSSARLVERIEDLNEYRAPVMVLEVPAEHAPDATWYEWYLECGQDRFYPLLRDYAVDYETGKRVDHGWRPITFHVHHTDDAGAPTGLDEQTVYRFSETGYLPVNKIEAQRRP